MTSPAIWSYFYAAGPCYVKCLLPSSKMCDLGHTCSLQENNLKPTPCCNFGIPEVENMNDNLLIYQLIY